MLLGCFANVRDVSSAGMYTFCTEQCQSRPMPLGLGAQGRILFGGGNKLQLPSAGPRPQIHALTPDLRFCVCDSIRGGGPYGVQKVHAPTGTVDGDTMKVTMSARGKTGNWTAERAK